MTVFCGIFAVSSEVPFEAFSAWQARGREAAAEALGKFGPAAAESPRAIPRLLRLLQAWPMTIVVLLVMRYVVYVV